MQFERMTIKSQEAIRQAQRLAEPEGRSEVDVEHLLLTLLDQEDGVVTPMLGRLGVAPDAFRGELQALLKRKPTVQGAGSERYLGRGLKAVLERAAKLAEDMKDEYVSTEHLFLAALEDAASPAAAR